MGMPTSAGSSSSRRGCCSTVVRKNFDSRSGSYVAVISLGSEGICKHKSIQRSAGGASKPGHSRKEQECCWQSQLCGHSAAHICRFSQLNIRPVSSAEFCPCTTVSCIAKDSCHWYLPPPGALLLATAMHAAARHTGRQGLNYSSYCQRRLAQIESARATHCGLVTPLASCYQT